METDRKALAERLRNGLMKHEDGVLVKVKGEAFCTVRDLRAAATALREEGEPVGVWVRYSCGCQKGTIYNADGTYCAYHDGDLVESFDVYRHPHTEDESDER